MRAYILTVALLALIANNASAAIVHDFVGVYAPVNWNSLAEGNGLLTVSEDGLVMVSPFGVSGGTQDVEFTIAAQGDGLFSFDWEYAAVAAGDPAFYFNGSSVPLADFQGASLQFGTISVAVSQGDTIGWRLRATYTDLSAAALEISNFSAPDGAAVPEPTSLVLWSLGLGLVAWRTRRKIACA